MPAVRRASAVVLAAALALVCPGAWAQICNSADPESGGLIVPALGTGGAIVSARLAVLAAISFPNPLHRAAPLHRCLLAPVARRLPAPPRNQR